MLRLPLVIVALATSALPALALDLPARTSGLWELTWTQTDPPELVAHAHKRGVSTAVKECIDPAVNASFWQLDLVGFGGAAANLPCPPATIVSRDGTITAETACRIGPVNANLTITVQGDFARAYMSTIVMRFQPEGDAARRMTPARYTVTIAARYLGACAADQRPGDLIDDQGIIHVFGEQKPEAAR